MKVTALTAQQHDPNRVNVMVDGKFRFSLDVSQIVSLGIRVGTEYSDKQLAELETESQFGKLYARTLEYCLMRPHSMREVRDYLYRKTLTKKYQTKGSSFNRVDKPANRILERPGVSKEVAERVFDRLVDKGYVDDEKFARFWVENRNQRKGMSLRKLRTELQAKGVASDIIDSQLVGSERNDTNELQKIITRKRRQYPDDQKFMQYLARQGFAYDDIKTALNDGLNQGSQ